MDMHATAKPKLMILGGATGLLGQAMVQTASLAGYPVIASARGDFDPLNTASIAAYIDSHTPDIVCNTIAYTQVDKAEEEEEKALNLNRLFPRLLGRIIKERPSISLLHCSTDFVFNGRKKEPYVETDATDPLNVYGRSKLEGEKALLELQLENLCIVRTAWLFGPGKKNFVSTILGLCTEGKTLKVVHDQIGSPTYTMDLAAYCLHLLAAGGRGIFHIANSGQVSWCELASEAIRLAQLECPVTPIPSGEYPQKAQRPAFSALDCSKFTKLTGITPRSWGPALADYIFANTDHG
ncbi:dTDP-4-dehydrorhamnose reductase [uncultured delta proteobacterium]|uniref:dTDP-4-dehydrorhamnose reductase n=1 Tax=uncultured delta proteobacterium TaxID=34034 RepID=A0A212KHM2_9DELT|nr:dTDP-4-dehydrorhamnose reductase [uncultured delta proteobacterium]